MMLLGAGEGWYAAAMGTGVFLPFAGILGAGVMTLGYAQIIREAKAVLFSSGQNYTLTSGLVRIEIGSTFFLGLLEEK